MMTLTHILSRKNPSKNCFLSMLEWHQKCQVKLEQCSEYGLKDYSGFHLELALGYTTITYPRHMFLVADCSSLPEIISIVESKFPKDATKGKFWPFKSIIRRYTLLDYGPEMGRTPSGLPCYGNFMKCEECNYKHEVDKICTLQDRKNKAGSTGAAPQLGYPETDCTLDGSNSPDMPAFTSGDLLGTLG